MRLEAPLTWFGAATYEARSISYEIGSTPYVDRSASYEVGSASYVFRSNYLRGLAHHLRGSK